MFPLKELTDNKNVVHWEVSSCKVLTISLELMLIAEQVAKGWIAGYPEALIIL